MLEERLHFPLLNNLRQIIDLKMLPPNCKMVGRRVELDPMNWFLQLKSLHHLVVPLIYDIKSPLLTPRHNVVALAAYRVYIRFMNIPYFMAETTYPQIPHSDLFILTSCYTQFVVFEGHVFHLVVALEHRHWFYHVG